MVAILPNSTFSQLGVEANLQVHKFSTFHLVEHKDFSFTFSYLAFTVITTRKTFKFNE